MSIQENDWRLRGQERYMTGLRFRREAYPLDEEEHSHCEFCWQKIGYGNDSVLEGYVSSDGFRWVCEECFSDFKEAFGFTDESKGHDGF